MNAQPSDLAHPGHVFPLVAKQNGVFERRGHTEGSVDLVKLAGLGESAVLCELTNPDETMIKLPCTFLYKQTKNFRVMNNEQIAQRIFKSQNTNGFWKVLAESDMRYPVYLHYTPVYKATLWTLILLADIGHDKNDVRIKKPLREIRNHFFDPVHQIFCLGKDHFPIPCLNGNMVYLDCYFNGRPGEESLKAIDFFCRHQRFDDGSYLNGKNEFCSNTSCYGKHTCYWGVIKLLKGISFIPKAFRTDAVNQLMEKCIRFILLHRVCYSSHREDKIMIKGMDQLSFPNMYKSDFLEILWLLEREQVRSEQLYPAIGLLKSKRLPSGEWNLERKVSNMTAGVGEINTPNPFITQRAAEVLDFYSGL